MGLSSPGKNILNMSEFKDVLFATNAIDSSIGRK